MLDHQLSATLRLVREAWRFRSTGLLAVWAAFAMMTLGIYAVPDRYEAGAQIYVDTKSMLRPLLEGLAVSANTDAQAHVVQRSLLARPTLEAVAQETGLAQRATTPRDLDMLLSSLGKKVSVTGDVRTSLYSIRYADTNAEMAFSVVKSLLDTFVKQASGEDRADAENAEKFLVDEVKQYEKRLTEAEQRLADFKKQNVGLMPDDRGDYFARYQQESAVVDKIRTDLAVARRQQGELRSKIVVDGASGAPTAQQIQSATFLDAQLAKGRADLESLLLRFTDKHPQVIAKREEIQRLEARRRTEAGAVTATVGAVQGGGGVSGDSVVQNLQIGLNSADLQVATLSAQLAQAERRVGDLRRLVNVGPEVEAQLAQLNRDYGVTKSRYEALVQRLESARISDKAERSSELKFRVIEPPRTPESPSSPRRVLLLAGALLLSVAIGAFVAFALSQVRPVVLDRDGLRDLAKLPVIGVISRAVPLQQRKKQAEMDGRFRRSIFALAGTFAIAVVFAQPASKMLRVLLGVTPS